jgi:hypothetical protein
MAPPADRHRADLLFVADPHRADILVTGRALDLMMIGVKSNAGGKKNAVVRRTGDGKTSAVAKKIAALQIKSASAKRKEEEVKFVVAWKMNVGEKLLATRSGWPVKPP